MTELRKAQLTGIRVTVPAEALGGRPSGLPSGVVVERDRIEVRYAGAKEAVVKLVALALNNDYERFEALLAGEGSSGSARPWLRRSPGRRMIVPIVASTMIFVSVRQ